MNKYRSTQEQAPVSTSTPQTLQEIVQADRDAKIQRIQKQAERQAKSRDHYAKA